MPLPEPLADIADRIVPEGREYAVIWAVSGLMIVVSLFFFRGTKKEEVADV